MSVEIDLSGANIPGLPKKMEIKNAAQEETLKEILKLMQQQQKLSEKMLKVSEKGTAANNAKGGGGGGAGKSTKANEKAQQDAAKAANNNAKAMQKSGIGLGIMTAAVVRNASALNILAVSSANLIRAFSNVGDSVTEAAGELGKIPFVGTLLQATLGATADAANKVYNSYTQLAASGATFDGSMRTMVKAATGAGLTFDQFSGLLAKNSQSLRLLGGTTEAGAKRFAELSKSMRTSGLNDSLLKMGYTTEQVNDGMLQYIDNFGRGGAAQKMTTEELTQSSADYLTEIDALAKITGTTRDEKAKELQELARDAKFRAATAKMSAEDRAMLAKHIGSLPKSAQAATMDMITTGTATTDAAVKMNAMMSGSSQEAMRIGQTLRRGGKITQEQLDQNRKNMIQEAKVGRIRYQDQGIYNEKMRETYGAMDDIAQLEVDGKEKAVAEQEAIAKQSEDLATKLGKLKQDIAGVGNKFALELLNDQALDSLRTAFMSMSDFVMAFVVPIFKLTIAVISPFIKIIGGVVSIISKTLGPTLNIFAEIIGGISSAFTTVLTPAFEGLGWVAENLLAPALVAYSAILVATNAKLIANSIATGYQTAVTNAKTLADKAQITITNLLGVAKSAELKQSVLTRFASMKQTASLYANIMATKLLSVSKIAELKQSVLTRFASMKQTASLYANTFATNAQTKGIFWSIGHTVGATIASIKQTASVYASIIATKAQTLGVWAVIAAKKAYALALVALSKAQTLASGASSLLGGRFKGLAGSALNVGSRLLVFGKGAAVAAKGFLASGAIAAGFAKVAAVFMGGLAFVGKGIALAGAVIASPAIAIGAAIAAAAAGVYLVVKYWDNIVGFISNIGTKLKNAFFGVLDSIKATAKKLNPLNWFSDDDEETSQAPNESSAETARLSRQNTEISPEMQRSLKLSDMWSEGEDNSELIEVGEKQLAASNRLAQGMGKLDQSNKLLNETITESNELAEDEEDEKNDKNKSKPSSSGKPTSGQSPGAASPGAASPGAGSGRPSARSGSISDDIPSMTPSGGSGPTSDSPGGGSKKAPSASGGKDGPSAGKKSSSGGQDGGAGGSGGGGGGAKPQSTGRPTGKGGTMSEEDTKAMIIEHEGIRYEPYKDSLGLWTVGVGHLIGDGKTLPPEYNRKFSHEEVMAMFEKDYDKHKKQAQSNVPGFGKFDSLGQAALVDLTFNMGPGWPKKFKNTSAKLGAGDTAGAAEGLTNSKWYTQVGRRAPIITGMIRESKVSARDGGIFDGPKSGYPATLHGEEAVVPLKGGNIPVEMGGNASQTEMINLLSALNSKMEHLVALNSAIADLNSSQLKAQKKMGNTELLV
jgi:lysozyme